MQPPHLLLFLFLPLLLPGMWADPEAEPQVLQVLLTSLFDSISSVEMSGVAFLGDTSIFTLDPTNWNIRFHWPWASQAASQGDAEKLMAEYKIFLRNMIRFVHSTVQEAKEDYPLVIQLRVGCVLYPNKTSWGFMDVGEGGRDLAAFNVERQRWETHQSSTLAELVTKSLNGQKSVLIFLEELVAKFCPSQILNLHTCGRTALERQ
ncbi:PREDICTED: antigen-presenting glycoprotein CD1d, partial [Acanthisitta chloris]|uniref:antigen-presenting glycoprotein CD1d n=1 Tax=Acanthisitta chloris TaxID=57068 RepID=UPI0004F0D3F7